MNDTITIKTADLSKAHAIAAEMGLVIDRMYGGLKETMSVGARKAGPRGNHEPKWTREQQVAFCVAFDGIGA